MGNAVVVMGVSGSGKSTVGAELARLLNAEFVDGDDLHPPANRIKMAAGTPLTDDDRWPWLEAVRERLAAGLAEEEDAAEFQGDPGAAPGDAWSGGGVVVACSALRRAYRDVLRRAGHGVRFVYLDVDAAEVEARLGRRNDHFFPPELVPSQFATLERPEPDSEPDVVTLKPVLSASHQAEAARARIAELTPRG